MTTEFQLTAARRRLEEAITKKAAEESVSTHSRPKAAGVYFYPLGLCRDCFNSQPPEGGWNVVVKVDGKPNYVSTHSRPKAAGV